MWFGSFIKNVPQKDKRVLFATFDDGPSLSYTPALLDVLERNNARATFFVITKNAIKNKSLLHEILKKGHSIGDHSLDHNYKIFFQGEKKLYEWIHRSHEELTQCIGEKPIGFRSPAGVRTPELTRALARLNIPHIGWRFRYFDTVFKMKTLKYEKTLKKAHSGDIFLFHDGKNALPLLDFERAMDSFFMQATCEQFQCLSLLGEHLKIF
jgi:peptidoglycan/xylan/chitin deacetylase (PgdA/CDA1 family)